MLKIILKYPWLNIILVAAVTACMAYSAAHLQFDTSLSAFIIKDDPDMAYYNKVKDIFETDETIIIAFRARNLFSKKDLTVIKELSEAIGDIEYIRNVRSLTNENLISATEEVFEIKGLVAKMPETPEEEAAIRKHATANYIYTKDLASEDGRFGSFLIDIQNAEGRQYTKSVIEQIKPMLQGISERSGLTFYLAGDAIINYSLGEYMQRDMFATTIPLFGILVFLLVITIGRFRDVVISIVTIILSLIWTVGVISLLGKTLNNVTIGLMPLILCIAVEDIYYIHNAYYTKLQTIKDKRKAFLKALQHIAMPCLFTSITTTIGFASLMVNRVKPIMDFGILGSIAVVLTFVIAVVLIPSIHLLLPIPDNPKKTFRFKPDLSRPASGLYSFIYRYRKAFFVAIPVLLIIEGIGISMIRIETDHLTFFHETSDVYQSTMFVEDNVCGVSNIEITIDTQKKDGIKDPLVLQQVEKLVAFLRKQPKIDKALSLLDFLKDMNRAMHNHDESYYRIPETRELVASYLFLYSMSERRNDVEKDFVDYPYQLTRVRCRTSEHNSTLLLNMVSNIKSFISSDLPPDLDIKVTSYPVVYSNMVDSIARGQKNSLGWVMLSLLAAMIIYFRSVKIGLLTMIPTVVPMMTTFAVMGFLGISLNVGTAMTVGIAIGLAMNDTTHFLVVFRENRDRCPDYLENTKQTLIRLSEPMIFSSIVMIAGYLNFGLSQFRLSVLFGLLCALTIFVALLSDLLITPWIMIAFKPQFRKNKETASQDISEVSVSNENAQVNI
ncbi:RND family transporter [Planctomycetota bacterium]